MAIWQFTFHLVPRQSVERLHGSTVISLAAFSSIDPEKWDSNEDHPNYWEGRSTRAFAPAVGRLLPPRTSWSPNGLMFGDEEGDDIDLWEDDFRVRLHLGQFNLTLARAVVDLAAAEDLMLVMAETGRLVPPTYDRLAREIGQSRSFKFVSNPVETLRMILRAQE